MSGRSIVPVWSGGVALALLVFSLIAPVPSQGQNTPQDPRASGSFFDVFFDVEAWDWDIMMPAGGLITLTGTIGTQPIRERTGTCPIPGSIPIEIQSMELTGNDPGLGPVVIRKLQSQPAPGCIGPQESFFDIYFEIEFQGQTYHGEQSLRFRNIPNTGVGAGDWMTDQAPVPLLDSENRPTGRTVSRAHEKKVPRPTPTATRTSTGTATSTATATATPTITSTPTVTSTPTITSTPTTTGTRTSTSTRTETPSRTPTEEPTETRPPTDTPRPPTRTNTPPPPPTETYTPTRPPTNTFTVTATPTIVQRPVYSVAPNGPTGCDPGDLLVQAGFGSGPCAGAGSPDVFITCADLTLPASCAAPGGSGPPQNDNVNALSFANDRIISGLDLLFFSVASGSAGCAGTAVATQATLGTQDGDEFQSTPAAVGLCSGTNSLYYTEAALNLAGFAAAEPPNNDDELDALAWRPVQGQLPYFTLSPGSPTLAAIGADPSDILVKPTLGVGAPAIAVDNATLGLTRDDVIDGLCIFGTPTLVQNIVFSLAPGSPSLGGFSPADLLRAGPTLYRSAGQYGLLATDNIDAVKCVEDTDIPPLPTRTPTPQTGASPTPCITALGLQCTPTLTSTPCVANGTLCTPTPTAISCPTPVGGVSCEPTVTSTPCPSPTAPCTPTPTQQVCPTPVGGVNCAPTPSSTPCAALVTVCTPTPTPSPCGTAAAGPCTATPTPCVPVAGANCPSPSPTPTRCANATGLECTPTPSLTATPCLTLPPVTTCTPTPSPTTCVAATPNEPCPTATATPCTLVAGANCPSPSPTPTRCANPNGVPCTPTPTPEVTSTPCVPTAGANCPSPSPTPTRCVNTAGQQCTPTPTPTSCIPNEPCLTPTRTPVATSTPCIANGTLCTRTPTPTPCSVLAVCTATPTPTLCAVNGALCTPTATPTSCVTPNGAPCTQTPTRTATKTPLVIGGGDVGILRDPVSPNGLQPAAGTGTTTLDWASGVGQTGYVLLRYLNNAFEVIPPLLGPEATMATDPALLSGLPCYLIGILTNGPFYVSDMLCVAPNSRSGAAPRNFHLTLNQSQTASLTWLPPSTGAPDSYLLAVLPLTGAPPTFLPLGGGATSTSHNTGGVPTCYLLVAFVGGNPSGNTDALCGIPGVATIGSAGAPSAPGGAGLADVLRSLQSTLPSGLERPTGR